MRSIVVPFWTLVPFQRLRLFPFPSARWSSAGDAGEAKSLTCSNAKQPVSEFPNGPGENASKAPPSPPKPARSLLVIDLPNVTPISATHSFDLIRLRWGPGKVLLPDGATNRFGGHHFSSRDGRGVFPYPAATPPTTRCACGPPFTSRACRARTAEAPQKHCTRGCLCPPSLPPFPGRPGPSVHRHTPPPKHCTCCPAHLLPIE